MRRDELVRLAAAASRIVGGGDVVVVGAAALLAVVEVPEGALAADAQADLFSLEHPDRGDLIDAALGVESMYHDEHGVWARGSGPLAPVAPAGWLDRLVPIQVGGSYARCMEPHDLVLAKLAVGRGKDLDFCVAALEEGLVRIDELRRRIDGMPGDELARDQLRVLLERVSA